MKIRFFTAVIVLLTLSIIVLDNEIVGKKSKSQIPTTVATSSIIVSSTTMMRLTSSAFSEKESIPSVYTCDGSNTSPELSISGVPVGAKSLVLLMDDPDVPTSIKADGIFDHWVMYDIEADTKVIQEGKFSGTLGANGTGKTGYIGPCPPDRQHRYFFKLYALDQKLGFPEGKTKQEILSAIEGHVLESSELIGLYERKKW